ncbi:MAG TPA: hypothetical protein VMD04_01420 [Candidatus Margulisiibacteriota bacterium]|nr:hypothetical protein [Candidatus Margulisiibacteriota bacterium]
MQKKGWLWQIGSFILSFLILFIGLESAAILYVNVTKEELPEYVDNFDDSNPLYIFDADLGYRLRPNHTDSKIKTNNLGFRDSEDFYLTENASRKRVLVLGDSMVFGVGVAQDKIFSEILKKESPGYIFINSGVTGYDTVQEYLVLKRYIDIVKPDVVILFFTEANDMFMNMRGDQFLPRAWVHDGKLNIDHARHRSFAPWYKKLVFYRLLDKHIIWGRDPSYFFNKAAFLVFGKHSNPFRVTKAILHEMGNLCRQHNLPLIIMDIPSPNQLKYRFFSRSRQDFLHEISSEEGFSYYDLANYYPLQYSEIFLPHDSHYNERGHKFIASLVMKILLVDFNKQ